MDKKYDHKKYESTIYKMWEDGGYFKAEIDQDKKPYTIVLPPPNASGKMHIGNVLMIAIEDLLIRWKRMQGYSALWVPGTDHAGFETQIKFERKLKESGKSRFDYDRETLYQKIWVFVQENKSLIENQIREMGASVDWDRYKFTLDTDVVETVLNTFKKLHQNDLIYRDDYMVNYCPVCGTTFADLEVTHQERVDPLYFIKYPIKDSQEFITIATVRPETMFGDVAIAVHPNDDSKKHFIGKTALLPLTDREIPIIADEVVDMEFGAGALKITPAHDPNDFEVAKRHGLPAISVVDMNGRIQLTEDSQLKELEGELVKKARQKTVDELKAQNLIEKVDENYKHAVTVCYKASHDIEPTILPNWFIKVENLKKPAHEAVKNGKVKIYPRWQEKKYHHWMQEMHDWPISRQVVWGIRIPAWYDIDKNPNLMITFLNKSGENVVGEIKELLEKYNLSDIEKGLQTLIAQKGAEFVISNEKPGEKFLQETDTFDTWFSSGQWPLVALGFPNSEDFEYFYPTSVLETGWEILRFWVSRMIMFGLYLTDDVPFHDVYLHGMVRAIDGRKMSKSLGNEIIPEDYQSEFGTDALRMGLIAGTAAGKDFAFPADKVTAYRNFANKIWNVARFMQLMFENTNKNIPFYSEVVVGLQKDDEEIIEKLNKTITSTTKKLEKFRFAQASEEIYHFVWDDFASGYLETIKDREDKEITLSVFRYVLLNSLILLHPFMPFVTEAVWQEIKNLRENPDVPLIISSWPQVK